MGHGYANCCAPSTGFVAARRYFTREERARWLEEYADTLEKELAGVRERVKELKGE